MRGALYGAICALAALPALAQDSAELDAGSGIASYYGSELAGARTASGERCDPDDFTAAHRTIPFDKHVRVTSVATGRSIVVRINDRGPFRGNRIIDLSRAAARAIGLDRTGTGPVRLTLLRD